MQVIAFVNALQWPIFNYSKKHDNSFHTLLPEVPACTPPSPSSETNAPHQSASGSGDTIRRLAAKSDQEMLFHFVILKSQFCVILR